jgi:hypothetical protein
MKNLLCLTRFGSHVNGAKFLTRAQREDCVVADAVVVEPVCTAEFPANKEKNRDVFNEGLFPDRIPPVSLIVSER